MTLFAETAHDAATSDREATADLRLAVAVAAAIESYAQTLDLHGPDDYDARRAERLPVTEAAAELTRAGESAARMLGDGS